MKPIPSFEPVPVRARHDGWTAERQMAFIEALADTGCVDQACRRVGMSDTSAYKLRRRPCGADFRRAWEAAVDCATPRVEQAAMDRMINGVPRPIFYKGEQVGEYRHFDERLTIFFLRARRPDRYGKWLDRMMAPDPETHYDPAELLDAELDQIAERAPEEQGNPEDEWALADARPPHADDFTGAGADTRAHALSGKLGNLPRPALPGGWRVQARGAPHTPWDGRGGQWGAAASPPPRVTVTFPGRLPGPQQGSAPAMDPAELEEGRP